MQRHACVVAVCAALAVSCGPQQNATKPDPNKRLPTVKPSTDKVEPFDRKKTKPRYQAVILGSKPDGKSDIIPLAGVNNTVTVDAMWVRTGGGVKVSGGSSKVWLTTNPQMDGNVRVGMYERYAGGMGPQWRAAVWISSFVASTVLGKDLTDFKFTAENDGYIDGASAGTLMTAGFLASLTGAEIDPEATMTGIVNPDGTVGPVGGIPHKFEGSIKKGKKRLGYPVGQQFDYDMNTMRKVDVAAIAKKAGVEAAEINDVYEAYEFLTKGHKKLPKPIPVKVGEMALGPAVDEALTKHYKDWRTHLNEEWSRLTQLTSQGKLPFGLRSLAKKAEMEGRAAEENMSKGEPVTAYTRVVQAVIYAATATAVYDVLEKVRAGNFAAARAKLNEFQSTASETEATLQKVGEMRPDTIGGHLLMVSAFQSAIQGWGFHDFGGTQMPKAHQELSRLQRYSPDQLAIDTKLHDSLVREVIPPILSIARAVTSTRVAMEALEIEGVKSLNYMCSLPNVRRLAASFSSAAAANLAYYESLFVKDTANRYMVPEDRAKVILQRSTPDYLVAWMAFQLRTYPIGLPAKLRKAWGEGSLPWLLGTLAGGILSYYKTSLLISKGYSLRVQTNPFTGEPSSVQHQKAFTNMMKNAERKAREHARAALVATGSIPIQARLHYQNARTMRDSAELSDRIRALELYWASSVYSQAAAMLARN